MNRLTRDELIADLVEFWIDAHIPNKACIIGYIKDGGKFPGYNHWSTADLKETYENLMDEEIQVVELVKETA